jgi:hypothetical protein
VQLLGSKLSEIQAQLHCEQEAQSAIYTMFDADAAGIGQRFQLGID